MNDYLDHLQNISDNLYSNEILQNKLEDLNFKINLLCKVWEKELKEIEINENHSSSICTRNPDQHDSN